MSEQGMRARRNDVRQTYKPGCYVLYRDADRYLSGSEDHTRVCRVGYGVKSSPDRVELIDLRSGETIQNADPAYIRKISAAEIMADIDTSPLDAEGAPTDLPSAAISWLRQQGRQSGGGR